MNSTFDLPRGGTLLVGLILYALILVLTVIRERPPEAKPADAPATEFSGARAMKILQQLVGDGAPHPVGSAADAAVRQRIVAELTRLGYQPRIQTGFACNSWGTCAEVKNVLARLEGNEPGPAVMMASHYDSVPAGPGASDDGAGVAAELEIARALKAAPPPRHPTIFLIDEGEEAGLLGAEAFVTDDPWTKDVRAVVNVEARGTSGPSAMFETGSANLWLMKLYAGAAERPSTSSINYTIYKLLPSDTDFTIFKGTGAGYQGFNFAFIGDVAHYHTPLDNVVNADPRSIQQQGENALATLRTLANSDLKPRSPSEAVFFDLFGWMTIYWPAGWTVIFAGVALVLLVIEIAALLRRGRMTAREFFFGVLSWLVMLVAAGLFGGCFYFILGKCGALPVSWVAHPAPMLVAFWALGFFAVSLLVLGFRRGAGFFGLWTGTWIWWALVALVLALLAPGLSYVFVLPSLAAAFCGLWAVVGKAERSWKWGLAVILPGLVAGAILFPLIWFVYDAMGAVSLPVIAILVALLMTPLAAAMGGGTGRARWGFTALAFFVFLASGATALVMPAFSTFSPERMNLDYYQDTDSGKAHWLATPRSGTLPAALRAAAAFSDKEEAVQDLVGAAYTAGAPNLNLPAPTLTIEKATPVDGKYLYEVRLRSLRGAPEVALGFPPGTDPESVSMNGYRIAALTKRVLQYTSGWHTYVCETVPPEGIEVEFTLPSGKPATVRVLDKSFGLPPEGAFLEKARPRTTVASQDGDVTLVSRAITLNPAS